MSKEPATTKPSTAKPGWREDWQANHSESTSGESLLEIMEKAFKEDSPESWNDLPPNTQEGISHSVDRKGSAE